MSETNTAATTFNFADASDDAMVVSLSGYIGLLPPVSDPNADPATIAAANRYRRHAIYTAGQQQVAKLQKVGKTPAEIPAELNTWLATWNPEVDGTVSTLGTKRREIATELYARWFEGRGRAELAKKVRDGGTVTDKSGNDLFPQFMTARKADIDAQVDEWARTYTPPKPKGSKADSGEATATAPVLDEDEIDFSV